MIAVAMTAPASGGTTTTWTKYADDLYQLMEKINLKNAMLVGLPAEVRWSDF